ncbi:MAG: substrate-binding domain-containing protein [Acidimicrobiia bacterium]
MRRWLAVVLILVASGCGGGSDRVIVAAGTTLVDSGLIDGVVAEYESLNPGIEVSVVAEPTSLALELGRRGAADLLIVHASEQEAIFVEQGHSFASSPLVESRFVLVGPPDGRAASGLSVTEAFNAIASEGRTFVSRGDLSGTHERELSLWAALGFEPGPQEWYIETGQGMGQTLLIADQRSGFTLAELGAFLEARDALSLVDYQVTGEELRNPYTAYVAAAGSNRDGALELMEWLGSPEGIAVIDAVNLRLFGEIVYRPVTE